MMLGSYASLSGLRGIQTCDVVVDGNGNAVDCSLWSNFFHLACWNPAAPCAATGATDGQPATIDCSKSQLGTVGCDLLEQQGSGAGGSSIPWTMIALTGAAVIAGLLILR